MPPLHCSGWSGSLSSDHDRGSSLHWPGEGLTCLGSPTEPEKSHHQDQPTHRSLHILIGETPIADERPSNPPGPKLGCELRTMLGHPTYHILAGFGMDCQVEGFPILMVDKPHVVAQHDLVLMTSGNAQLPRYLRMIPCFSFDLPIRIMEDRRAERACVERSDTQSRSRINAHIAYRVTGDPVTSAIRSSSLRSDDASLV